MHWYFHQSRCLSLSFFFFFFAFYLHTKIEIKTKIKTPKQFFQKVLLQVLFRINFFFFCVCVCVCFFKNKTINALKTQTRRNNINFNWNLLCICGLKIRKTRYVLFWVLFFCNFGVLFEKKTHKKKKQKWKVGITRTVRYCAPRSKKWRPTCTCSTSTCTSTTTTTTTPSTSPAHCVKIYIFCKLCLSQLQVSLVRVNDCTHYFKHVFKRSHML